MAASFLELLPKSENEVASVATNFITNTFRTLLFSSTSVSKPNEADNSKQIITLEEVSDHDNSNDCWIIIYDRVYDITKFSDLHPGGYDILMEHAGRDCTVAFRGTGHTNEAIDSLKHYEIGILPAHQRLYRYPGTIRISGQLPD